MCGGQYKSLNLWVITYVMYLYIYVPTERALMVDTDGLLWLNDVTLYFEL